MPKTKIILYPSNIDYYCLPVPFSDNDLFVQIYKKSCVRLIGSSHDDKKDKDLMSASESKIELTENSRHSLVGSTLAYWM